MEQRVQYISWETQSALGKASLAARLVARFCGADSGSKRRRRHPKQGNQQRGLLRGSHEDGHQIRNLPLVFNVGFKATNASLLGLVGNAPSYQGRLFGAAAFALQGPRRSTILLGSEVLQQPRRVQDLPGAVVPTTITYALRIVPAGALPLHGCGREAPKLTIDFGVAQAAGNVLRGVNLHARHQFALGISYGF